MMSNLTHAKRFESLEHAVRCSYDFDYYWIHRLNFCTKLYQCANSRCLVWPLSDLTIFHNQAYSDIMQVSKTMLLCKYSHGDLGKTAAPIQLSDRIMILQSTCLWAIWPRVFQFLNESTSRQTASSASSIFSESHALLGIVDFSAEGELDLSRILTSATLFVKSSPAAGSRAKLVCLRQILTASNEIHATIILPSISIHRLVSNISIPNSRSPKTFLFSDWAKKLKALAACPVYNLGRQTVHYVVSFKASWQHVKSLKI